MDFGFASAGVADQDVRAVVMVVAAEKGRKVIGTEHFKSHECTNDMSCGWRCTRGNFCGKRLPIHARYSFRNVVKDFPTIVVADGLDDGDRTSSRSTVKSHA